MSPLFKEAPEVKAPDKFELAKQEYFNQPDGFPYGQFRLEDVNLPPEEEAEATKEDDEEAVAQEVVATQETGFGTCIGACLFLNIMAMRAIVLARAGADRRVECVQLSTGCP